MKCLLPLLLLTASGAFAAPTVPADLQAWVPWVLDQHPELGCPRLDGNPLCVWPGVLTLDLDEAGGRFGMDVFVERESDIALPGDTTWFPRNVTDQGGAALMVRQGDTPSVRLGPGNHRVEGRFSWPRLPESLVIPAAAALLDVRVRGEPVPFPRRERGGLLWLSSSASEAAAEDQLTLEVHRRVDDGVPVRVTTHLSLRVSGKAREADLGAILLPGFMPIQLSSGLPARLDEAKHLRVQLRPGDWELSLSTRSVAPVPSLTAPTLPAPWPPDESWVFAEASQVRTVRLSGPPGIDPQRTTIPADWRGLPAFIVQPGVTLTIEELRRGQAAPPPDRLDVTREWWLFQDGSGYVVRDTVQGELHQGGRLDVSAPATLGRAAVDGQDQLVTGTGGVELRQGNLQMTADLTYPRGSKVPAVGWNRDAQSVHATVHLPPGWRLIDVPGADRADGTWMEEWTLFDLFIVLLVGLGTWRVLGPGPAVASLLLLTLSWHEELAPRFTWLVLLLPLALEPRVSHERISMFLKVFRWAVVGILVIQVLLFARDQVRTGLFPQLEHGGADAMSGSSWGGGGPGWNMNIPMGGAMAPAAPPPPMEGEMGRAEEQTIESDSAPAQDASRGMDKGGHLNALSSEEKDGNGYQQKAQSMDGRFGLMRKRASQVDTKAVVQTGPGLPRWSWTRHDLTWNGPVASDHTIRLLLLPPWADLLLSFVRALGLAALAWRFAGFRVQATRPAVASAAALTLLMIGGFSPGSASAADLPSQELLDALEQRIAVVPSCEPFCVETSEMEVVADEGGVHIVAWVHAAADSALRLPGPEAAWVPGRVLVDGKGVLALRRLDDGYVAVRMPRGTHRVELHGPARDQLVLQFAQPPRVMTGRGEGWTLDGLRPDAPPPASIQLNRSRTLTGSGEPSDAASDLPAWLELEREFDLGIPWIVHHELRRLGPPGPAVLVRVPLLAGESPTTAGITVEAGEAVVALERDEVSRAWDSTIAEAESLSLIAPGDRPWTEIWKLDCSPIFHCETEGLAPTQHMEEGRSRPGWRPWPGEALTIRATRPMAVAGETTTIDSARLKVTPGRRMEEAELQLDLRSSQGGDQDLGLPPGAQVQSFLIDGVARPFEVQDGRLAFSVEPGQHAVVVAWRRTHEDGLRYRTPAVDLGRGAANVEIQLTVPDHRWLLYAGGPRWGPVVTLWQYIFIVIALAIVLGRRAPTPLSTLDWALLGLGMTQVPWPAAAIVVGWLIALGLRGQREDLPWWGHDIAQLVLLGWTPLALAMLGWGVWQGLVVAPDMGVQGAGSYGTELHWFADRSDAVLPQPWLIWLPRLAWRGVMLAWALWLALRFTFRWFGFIWRSWMAGSPWKTPPAVVKGTAPRT